MTVKILATLCLAAVAGLAGCGGGDKANTNTNKLNTNTANNGTAATQATVAPAKDAAAEAAVKDALAKKGFTDVTVEATASEVIIRGSIPKGKMAEVNQIAQETGKRKVSNQVVEK